jgi:hypothetical protein
MTVDAGTLPALSATALLASLDRGTLDFNTPGGDDHVAEPLEDEIVRYLASTWNCWWTARRIGAVLPHAAGEIEKILQRCWLEGRLRRKRGLGGIYEYQVRSADSL